MTIYSLDILLLLFCEHRRIDAFELWCWRRLLRVPWTARRFNQSILKEINPGISLERMKLKLKLQYFGHLMRRTDSLEKALTLGKIEGRWRRWRQRMIGWHPPTDGHESEQSPGVGDGQGSLASMESQRVGHNYWTHTHMSLTQNCIYIHTQWFIIISSIFLWVGLKVWVFL